MQKTMFEQEPIIVMTKTTSRIKLAISKAFALALHVAILFAGTSLQNMAGVTGAGTTKAINEPLMAQKVALQH
jgi:hypothetical protein